MIFPDKIYNDCENTCNQCVKVWCPDPYDKMLHEKRLQSGEKNMAMSEKKGAVILTPG
jgi:hypothetical protein